MRLRGVLLRLQTERQGWWSGYGSPLMHSPRSGILAGGNFIVDYVKTVTHYPEENMLTIIRAESMANGGGPYNVLKDLSALECGFPLEAAGLVGADVNGSWILEDCRSHRIDTTQLHRTELAPTSYTDAMTVESTGRRTFFHQPGANALLDKHHFDFSTTRTRIFHFGYLMLLPTLDSISVVDERTGASHVLEAARAAGLETSMDLVSIEHPDYSKIVRGTLPFVDHLIINEIEAGKIVGRPLDPEDVAGVLEATAEILSFGVGKSVVLHFEAGATAIERGQDAIACPSLALPAGFSKGSTGAGDAFAAGYLYALHEGWTLEARLDLAVCTAAACLTHPTPSAGVRPVQECLLLGKRFERRQMGSR